MRIKHKKFIPVFAVLLVVLAGCSAFVAYKVSADGANSLSLIGQSVKASQQKNDGSVVAKIGTATVTKKDFDTYAAMLNTGRTADNQLTDRQIVDKIAERTVWYDQALKNHFTASDDMVSQMVASQKQLVKNDPKLTKELNDFIAGTGLSEEQYWAQTVPVYRKALIIGQYKSSLQAAFQQKNNITDLQQLTNQFDAYCDTLTRQFESQEKIQYFIK